MDLLKIAKCEMTNLKHPYVGTEHLLLAILSDNDYVAATLNRNGLNYNNFKNELIKQIGIGQKFSEVILFTPLLGRVIQNCEYKNSKSYLLSLLEEGEGIAVRIMISMNINLDELYKKLKEGRVEMRREDLMIGDRVTVGDGNILFVKQRHLDNININSIQKVERPTRYETLYVKPEIKTKELTMEELNKIMLEKEGYKVKIKEGE